MARTGDFHHWTHRPYRLVAEARRRQRPIVVPDTGCNVKAGILHEPKADEPYLSTLVEQEVKRITDCQSGREECFWAGCPYNRDPSPKRCPLRIAQYEGL